MLFCKENSEKTRCDICNESRYKKPIDLNKKKIPRKVLRYFPLTPRLQRLFMADKTADMHSFEAHARKVYSQNIFKLFENEFMQILHCQHNKK